MTSYFTDKSLQSPGLPVNRKHNVLTGQQFGQNDAFGKTGKGREKQKEEKPTNRLIARFRTSWKVMELFWFVKVAHSEMICLC